MKSTAIFFSALMIALFASIGTDLCPVFGINASTPLWHRYTYMFAHGSWIHLLVNVYSLLIIYFMAGGNWWQSIYSLMVSILIPTCILPNDDLMVVGASTFIYCMTGILVMNSEKFLHLIMLNISFIAVGLALPNTNIAVFPHIFCFGLGILFGTLTAKVHG